MNPRRVLLIGGTSEIGLAIVRRLAADGPVEPFLLGRRREELQSALDALHAGGLGQGGVIELDAENIDAHEAAMSEAGSFDVVILAVGVLGGQEALDADPELSRRVLRVGFLGAGSLLLAALRVLRKSGGGTLIVLSSVAAERPRASNAVYGAAKAGLDALAQGLADSLAGTPVRVLVVRPGFVRTRMTEGLPSAPFATTAEAVAEATARGLERGAHTVWVPGTLRYVFAVLRHLPRPLYRKLPL